MSLVNNPSSDPTSKGYKPFLTPGDVFVIITDQWARLTKSYWKVTEVMNPSEGNYLSTSYWTYRVVKCLEDGETYKEVDGRTKVNGFPCTLDEYLRGIRESDHAVYQLVKRGDLKYEVGLPDANWQKCKIQNRIGTLKRRIKSDKNEIADLEWRLTEIE